MDGPRVFDEYSPVVVGFSIRGAIGLSMVRHAGISARKGSDRVELVS